MYACMLCGCFPAMKNTYMFALSLRASAVRSCQYCPVWTWKYIQGCMLSAYICTCMDTAALRSKLCTACLLSRPRCCPHPNVQIKSPRAVCTKCANSPFFYSREHILRILCARKCADLCSFCKSSLQSSAYLCA